MKNIILLVIAIFGYLNGYTQNGTLEAENGVIVGDNTSSTTDGTIKYDGSDFWGLKLGNWQSLTASGNSIWSATGSDAYFLGKVGIGLNNPGLVSGVMLDVLGDVVLRGSSRRLDFKVPGGTTSMAGVVFDGTDFYIGASRSGGALFLSGNKDIRFRTDGSSTYPERMIITTDGDVGIGTDSPDHNLHVVDDVFATVAIEGVAPSLVLKRNSGTLSYFANSGSDLTIGNSLDGNIEFYNDGTQNMVITDQGNVGIRTTTPSSELDLNGDMRFSDGTGRIDFMEGNSLKSYISYNGKDLLIDNNEDDGEVEIDANDVIRFQTDNANRMMIANNGNVGIGTINPQEQLDLRGDLEIRHDDTNRAIALEKSTGHGEINLWHSNGMRTIKIDAQHLNNQNTTGGAMRFYSSTGENRVEINAEVNGKGRVITDEMQIKGGSDFAENFDIIPSKIEAIPGMIVSIDPNSTGKLAITTSAYDKKVAGVISGANGVETGLFMGQKGSIADGEYPIALTGRVYVYANDEGGNITPGDLLTTSSTEGYAMKVNDYDKAQGAIIGKAMTTIHENGFVLVLVNLQ